MIYKVLAHTITAPYFVDTTAVVTSLFTSADVLNGFWMQEEDIDTDADPNTSEGIFVLCGSKCPGGLTIGDLYTSQASFCFAVLDNSVDSLFIDTSNRPVLIQTFQQISTGE